MAGILNLHSKCPGASLERRSCFRKTPNVSIIFRLWLEENPESCQKSILRVRRSIPRIFWKRKHFFNFFRTLRRFISNFDRKLCGRVNRTAFYVFRRCFCWEFFCFSKSNIRWFTEFGRKSLAPVRKTLWQELWSCLLCVHRIVLATNFFLTKIHIFKLVRILRVVFSYSWLTHNFRQRCQEYNQLVQMIILREKPIRFWIFFPFLSVFGEKNPIFYQEIYMNLTKLQNTRPWYQLGTQYFWIMYVFFSFFPELWGHSSQTSY